MPSPVVDPQGASLVRFWMDRGLIDPVPPVQDLGARLGTWLDVRHAIQLHQWLGTDPDASRPVTHRARPADTSVARALDELRDAIMIDRFAPGLWRNPMPEEVPWPPSPWVEFWEPYRRYLVDHQKQMTLVLGRLRRQARAALSELGGQGLALAQLDAVYDQALTPRETRCLASLPHKLEQGLSAWVKDLGLTATASTDRRASIQRPAKPDGLLAFEQEIRQSLLAELQLRAQPVWGLIDAYRTLCP